MGSKDLVLSGSMCSTSGNVSIVNAWHQLLAEALSGGNEQQESVSQNWINFDEILLENTAAAKFVSLQHKIFGQCFSHLPVLKCLPLLPKTQLSSWN